MTARVPVGPGRAGLALDGSGRRALVARTREAVLVDLAAGRRSGTARLPAAAVAAAARDGAYVVAHADGRVSVLEPDAGGLAAPRVVRAGGGRNQHRGRGPDGRTAVVLDEGEDALVLVDVRAGRVLRRVEAPAPRDLGFAAQFALARSADGPQLTWVDLRTPTRSNVLEIAPGVASSGARGR